MTSQINNKLGIGSGLTLSEIAAAVVGAMPKVETIQPGQIVQFAAGTIPAGYTQIAGVLPSLPVEDVFGLVNPAVSMAAVAPYNMSIARASGKTFALFNTGTTSGPALYEVDDNCNLLSPTPYGGSVPGSAYLDYCVLHELPDGRLFYVGGTGTYIFNVTSKTWTTYATKPTSISHGRFATVGTKVYVFSANRVDAYDYASNTWTEAIVAAPSTAAPSFAVALASGKLVVGYTSAPCQVFNPQTLTFTPLSAAFTTTQFKSFAIKTSYGARIYVIASGISYADYYDSTGELTVTNTTAGNSHTGSISSSARAFGVQLANGNVAIMGSAPGISNINPFALIHYKNYTPRGIAYAIKDA